MLVNEIICQCGVPSSLYSDQGANFKSQVISSLYRNPGIGCTQTTAYHPHGNGKVEHFNYTLEAMLAKLVKENQKDWDLHIPKVLFSYRTTLYESTGYCPYQVNFG